jgi:hypothetical protein
MVKWPLIGAEITPAIAIKFGNDIAVDPHKLGVSSFF